jgi:hypothetical protein
MRTGHSREAYPGAQGQQTRHKVAFQDCPGTLHSANQVVVRGDLMQQYAGADV